MRHLLVLALLLGGPAAPAADLRGTVTHVPDGNTMLVRPDGERRPVTVKLIGLDAPHKATRDKAGQEPWGTRAQQWLALAAARKEVRVEFDVLVPVEGVPAGRWGYVWLGDRLLNEELLLEGHAVLNTAPPNVKYADRFREAQRDAREKNRNVWDPAEPLPEPPGKFVAKAEEVRERRQAVEDELSIPAFVDGCVVGNVKTKKYHVPGGRFYESSKASANAIFFKTKEDAEKAGYAASSR